MYDFPDELYSSASSENESARNAFKSKHCQEAKRHMKYNETLKSNIEEIFLEYIDPASFVHTFKKYSKHVLTALDIDNVATKQRNENRQSAARELLNILGRYDKWFPTFIKCLEDKNVKLYHLVDNLKSIEADVRAHIYENETSRKTSKGASSSLCGSSETSSWKNFFFHKKRKDISRELTEDHSDTSSSTDFPYPHGLPTSQHHRSKTIEDQCPCQLRSILKDLKQKLDARHTKNYIEIAEKFDLLMNIVKTYRNCYKMMFQVQEQIHSPYTKVSLLDISVARHKTHILKIKQCAVDIVLLCINSSQNVCEKLLTEDFIGIIVTDLNRLKFATFSQICTDEDSKTVIASLKRDMVLLLLTIVRNKAHKKDRLRLEKWSKASNLPILGADLNRNNLNAVMQENGQTPPFDLSALNGKKQPMICVKLTKDLQTIHISEDRDKFVSDMSFLLKCYICEELQLITTLKEKCKDPEMVLNDLLAHLRIYATYETPSIKIQMKVHAYVEGLATLATKDTFIPMMEKELFLSNVHAIVICFDDQSIYRAYVHLLTNLSFPQRQEMNTTYDPQRHTVNGSLYKTISASVGPDAQSQLINSDIMNCNDENGDKPNEQCVPSVNKESAEYSNAYLIPAENYDYATDVYFTINNTSDQSVGAHNIHQSSTCSQSIENDSHSLEVGDTIREQRESCEYIFYRSLEIDFEEKPYDFQDSHRSFDKDEIYVGQIDSGICSDKPYSLGAKMHEKVCYEEMLLALPVIQKEDTTSLQSTLEEVPGGAIDLKEIIGIGTNGMVRRGVMGTTKEVAVKRYEASKIFDQSILKEANIMKKLQHTNIVQFLGITRADGSCSLIMEYMRRGNLKSFLKSTMGRSSTLYDINGINLQITQGMHYLHGMGIVHRDLRASNILVGDHFVVKISDFDLAIELRREESAYIAQKDSKFPVRWSSPEAIFERKFSFKSDVWSFALVMFETITLGETPYHDLSNDAVLTMISKGAIISKPTNGPIGVPDSYFNVMLECREKIPEKRPDFARLQIYFENERQKWSQKVQRKA